MKTAPSFLVIAGDGINCERDTALALSQSGARPVIMHINDLLAAPELLEGIDGLAIPGGFSFGDELGSGQVMALKIQHKLGERFFKMAEKQKPVIGICNGFQVLVKLGLLPFPELKERVVALAPNISGRFMNRWVGLKVEDSRCLWTDGIEKQAIELPIRHGEGRIVFKSGEADALYAKLKRERQIPLTYAEDVNGSHERIAALTDPTGTVLGLMPHPEAFVFGETYKTPGLQRHGDGKLIFDNIMRLLQGREKHHEKRIA